jgi:ABC-type amino acid transport substrate-binding protein
MMAPVLSRGRRTACAAALLLALPLAACSDDGGNDEDPIVLTGVPEDLAEAGAIRIGVKYDQPGIGIRPPGADAPEGFDIEIGRIIADRLGIEEENITWVEAVSESREQFVRPGGGVVLDHRRAPRAGRPGRPLLHHRPAAADPLRG